MEKVYCDICGTDMTTLSVCYSGGILETDAFIHINTLSETGSHPHKYNVCMACVPKLKQLLVERS